MTHIAARRLERGMALLAALFMIIVLGALGLFAISIGQDQVGVVNLELLTRRATVAANMGIEWAAIRTAATNSCDPIQPRLLVNQALSGFNVNVRCVRTDHLVEGASYEITSIATFGAYGTPTYVRRTVIARLPS